MTIPVIVLNLKSSTGRRAKIETRLKGLDIDHRFFDALDGRSLSADERDRLAPRSALLFDRPLTAGEIGCAASHLAAIRQLAGEGHDLACVMEDDAVILSDDIRLFLQQQMLAALPAFDVLRMVSDRARWTMPSWQVAQIHGRGIYAMARPGWGTQGQIYSRSGLHKIARQIGPIRAPADFVLFHDCHVQGLRVLEIRPNLIEHDELFRDPQIQLLTDTGLRPVPDRRTMSFANRIRRNMLRHRRKHMAARNFVRIWGLAGLVRLLCRWPPGVYFR